MNIAKNTGIILSNNNYVYTGELYYEKNNNFLKNPVAHGLGKYEYINGDQYIGNSCYGKLDGFGKYIYKNKNIFIGFFSYGKIHGIGTYYDNKNKLVLKGQWRNDRKHGEFILTHFNKKESQMCLYISDEIKLSESCEYVPVNKLQTFKENPNHSIKKKEYTGKQKKCICCEINFCNAVNDACGHVSVCHSCLIKCDKCPICRTRINNIIKLYHG
jgi:hypothetical protein